MVISLKHSLSFIQMRNKTDILGPTVKGLILKPLSHKLYTDTAFGSDSLSSIMYCKWIKLMRPSPFCCWTVFISLIYIHKSYSVSQLNLLCCWLNEKCNNRPLLVWWTDMCSVLSSLVWALPRQYMRLDLVFFPLCHHSRFIIEQITEETLPSFIIPECNSHYNH